MSIEQPLVPTHNFNSRKDFMQYLEDMMIAAEETKKEEELGEETRGRPTELKTYIMESNNGLPRAQEGDTLRIFPTSTNLPQISVIRLEYNRRSATFYLDATDPRFLLLYTNDIADITDKLYGRLVESTVNRFDRIWLPTEIQGEISHLSGNVFRGFGLMFDDLFAQEKRRELPIDELRMSASGVRSGRALEALSQDTILKRSVCYSKIRVERGNSESFVTDEVRYNGRVITKSGQSIDDHVSLIEITRKIYRNLIEEIERNSIGTKQVDGRTLVEGQAFELVLDRQIDDLDRFTERLLSSSKPFRLWGIVNKISKDMRQIVAVDLHTGDPLNLEITSSLIRIYLPRGSCGNTILRLYVNLQHSFDSAIRFDGETKLGAM
jgi:hypothetical protein